MGNENYNRRDFLKTSLKTIAVGSIALSAFDVKKLIAGSNKNISSATAKVINLSDYPSLESVGGNTTIGTTYISRTGQSKFLALSLICTHKKCDVDKTESGFECPCHGSTFSSTGKVLEGPAKKNLRSYKTTYNADNNTLTIKM
jgi:Rieske Fe-S protein